MKTNEHIITLIKDVLDNLDNENYYEHLVLPEPFLKDLVRVKLNKYNHHCLPFVSQNECIYLANHLKAMADELECYQFNDKGYY